MRKFSQFIQDAWEVVGAFLGIAIMVYEFLAQLILGKGFSINSTVWVGMGLFVFFWNITHYKRKKKGSRVSKLKA